MYTGYTISANEREGRKCHLLCDRFPAKNIQFPKIIDVNVLISTEIKLFKQVTTALLKGQVEIEMSL